MSKEVFEGKDIYEQEKKVKILDKNFGSEGVNELIQIENEKNQGYAEVLGNTNDELENTVGKVEINISPDLVNLEKTIHGNDNILKMNREEIISRVKSSKASNAEKVGGVVKDIASSNSLFNFFVSKDQKTNIV